MGKPMKVRSLLMSLATICARRESAFCYIVGSVMLASGLIKILSLFGTGRSLSIPDPVLLAPTSWILRALGPAETVFAVYLFRGRSTSNKLVLIAGIAGLFGVYRIGLWVLAPHEPCKCLSTVLDWLPNLEPIANPLLTVGLVLMLIGSLFFLSKHFPHKASP